MTELARAEVVIGGDDNPLAVALTRAQRNLQNAGQKMQRAGRRLTTAVTLPLAAIGGASVKAFADFDSAMNQSLAIMGEVSTEMQEGMVAAAKSVARETTTSATEAAESYFFLASAGLDAAQSVAALPQVARFAQAGMFDMSTATDLATDAQSALGLTVDDAAQNLSNLTRVTDVLVKANTLANATVQQFSTSLTREAGAALKTFGKDVEEGVAVLAAFADQGIKGEMAGTGLSRVMRLMSAAAVNNQEAMADLGIEFFDSEGNMRNMADVVENLTSVLDPMSDAQRAAALESIGFTARVQGIIQPLLGTSESIREYEAALREASGMTQEVADKQLRSFSAQLKIAKNNVVLAAMEVGEKLAPAVASVGEVVSGAAQHFAALSGRTQATIIAVAGMAAAAGPLLLIMGGLVSSVGAIVGAFTGLLGVAGSIAGFFTTIGGLIGFWPVALAGIAAAIITVTGGWQRMGEMGVRVFGAILDAAKAWAGWAGPAWRTIFNALIGGFRFLGEVAVIIWEEFIRDPAVDAFRAIKRWAEPVLRGIAAGLEFIGKLGKGAAEAIKGFFTDAADGGEEEGASLGSRIAQAAVTAFGEDYVGGFIDIVKNTIERAKELIRQAIETLRAGKAAEELTKLEEDLNNLGEGLNNVGSSGEEAGDVVTEKMNDMHRAANSALSSFQNMFASLITGSKSFGAAIKDMAASIISDIARIIAKALALRAILSMIPGAEPFLQAAGMVSAPGKAGGGSVASGRPYLVGERGPEMFVPATAGQIVPNDRMGGGGMSPAAIAEALGPVPKPMTPNEASMHSWYREFIKRAVQDNAERVGGG